MTTHGHGPASPATSPATNEPRIRRQPASNEVLFLTNFELGALVACKQRIDLRIERTPPATGRAAKVVFLHKEIFCHRCILKPETGITPSKPLCIFMNNGLNLTVLCIFFFLTTNSFYKHHGCWFIQRLRRGGGARIARRVRLPQTDTERVENAEGLLLFPHTMIFNNQLSVRTCNSLALRTQPLLGSLLGLCIKKRQI